MRRLGEHWSTPWILAAAAFCLCAMSARPYAGGWNDGCRLAAVESLIDRGTLAIDDSVFRHPPQALIDAGHPPYASSDAISLEIGTLDKLFVRGRFYSDKPAVVSVLMAGAYRPLLWFGAPRPADRPDVFAWIMTVMTSGAGYALAVVCMWTIAQRLGLDAGWRLLWIASFALATFALTYTRHVNAHIMHLGVLAAIGVCMLNIATESRHGRGAWGHFVALGTLVGLGFNLDFGIGPLLAPILFVWIFWRTMQWKAAAVYSAAVIPWVIAPLAIHYAIGGVLLPLNMYPEHFQWQGSPFTPENLTGAARHDPWSQLRYTAGLMFGKKGVLNHNLPLLLAAVAGWTVLSRARRERAELLALLIWGAGSWLSYALLSNNWAGNCCSIRWLVPLLVPGFWVLALVLRDRPEWRVDFLVLTAWGCLLSAVMWWGGPWKNVPTKVLWPIVAATLISWCVLAWRRVEWFEKRSPSTSMTPTIANAWR